MTKAQLIAVPAYYTKYIDLIPEDNLLDALHRQRNEIMNLMMLIPASKENFAYDEGKWTIKELLLHIMDVERILSYRALAFARGEKQSLPGFDENEYAKNCLAKDYTLTQISDDFYSMRNSTITFFKTLPEGAFSSIGSGNKNEVSVGAISFMIVGHAQHHCNILKERYGIK